MLDDDVDLMVMDGEALGMFELIIGWGFGVMGTDLGIFPVPKSKSER